MRLQEVGMIQSGSLPLNLSVFITLLDALNCITRGSGRNHSISITFLVFIYKKRKESVT
jgi:hypothetical protein